MKRTKLSLSDELIKLYFELYPEGNIKPDDKFSYKFYDDLREVGFLGNDLFELVIKLDESKIKFWISKFKGIRNQEVYDRYRQFTNEMNLKLADELSIEFENSPLIFGVSENNWITVKLIVEDPDEVISEDYMTDGPNYKSLYFNPSLKYYEKVEKIIEKVVGKENYSEVNMGSISIIVRYNFPK
jgi:hypothetical protein